MVVDDVVVVVVVTFGGLGTGAPVEKRHPAPGGVKADMLTIGGGRFFVGSVGCVVGVVGVDDVVEPLVVVVIDVVDVVTRTVVVGSAAVGR
jgi:hypothetical protein